MNFEEILKWADEGSNDWVEMLSLMRQQMQMKGILVTTSEFTEQAREFATGLPLELINGEELRRLLAQDAEQTPGSGAR